MRKKNINRFCAHLYDAQKLLQELMTKHATAKIIRTPRFHETGIYTFQVEGLRSKNPPAEQKPLF